MKAVVLPLPPHEVALAGRDRKLLHWLSTVDHKEIGILYLLTALLFFAIGGIEALLIRTQLAVPNNHFLSPEAYDQVFTMHGITMIFFVMMPALLGLTVYLTPLMIGANEMAFPRLNAFSFWITFFGGLLLYFSFAAGGAPDAGWFNYAPLNQPHYSYSPGIDYYGMGLLLGGVGSMTTAANLVVTVLTMRVKGMTLTKLPLFVWMALVNGFLIVAAIPCLNAALVMLLLDRLMEAHFFNTTSGGSALLWQHFFWLFGHPEVYILILPAFGIYSEVFQVFSQKKIFGYALVAASTVAIALLSFGVWVHHMFAAGLGNTVNSFFAASSMLIGVPTGIKIFNWIGTMYGGRIRFTVSMLFAIAFLIEFTIGGLSGIAFSIVPIDLQLTDSYFVVAHFHYVLLGGSLFGLFSAIFYWFPKITGRMLNEKAGRWFFWLFVAGFNLTFFLQHFLGILGMSRRVYTYAPIKWYTLLNFLSTAGAYLMGVASVVLIYNIFKSLKAERMENKDPWNAMTLEWYADSPPGERNFVDIPVVESRTPLWDMKSKQKNING
jgi:cytochrome c oxidase subunit I